MTRNLSPLLLLVALVFGCIGASNGAACNLYRATMPGVGETQIHKNVVSMSPNYPNGTLASEYMVTLETVAVVENRDRKAAGGNCYLGFMEDHLNRSNEQYKKIYLEDCDCRLMTPTFQNVGPNMTLYTAGSSFTYPMYPDFQLNITGAFSSNTFQRELNGTGHFATYTYVLPSHSSLFALYCLPRAIHHGRWQPRNALRASQTGN